MSEKLKFMPGLLAVALILIGLVLAGCSAAGTGSTTQDASTTPAQTTTAPAQSGTTPASTDNSSGSPSGRRGGPDMSKQLSRAAQILGITEAQLTGAFQQARGSVFGTAPTGTPMSGASGQPSMPPSGTWGQQPPSGASGQQSPTGTSGHQPPQGGRGPNAENMQKLYSKMSEILNISADKISSAMDQARQEMQPTMTK